MLIAVFAFGILAQVEAFQISSNITDATDSPSPVSPVIVETEETISYTSETETSLLRQSNATEFPEANFTVSPETSTMAFLERATTVPPDDSTPVFPKVAISLTPELSYENSSANCPSHVKLRYYRLVVKCYCKGNEIYVDGKCQVHKGVIVIPVKRGLNYKYTKEENAMSYEVMVQDINCDTSRHSYMTFKKNQFSLTPRGDVVLLKEAGELEGQLINNYCISHYLDEQGDLTWRMKACVPIPSVPRCCPPGKAMQEGKCEVANTPDVLKPPISAKLFSNSVDWGNITNYYSPVICVPEYKYVATFRLGQKQSELVSTADGVASVLLLEDTDREGTYHYCNEYCVDGINNSDGSVDYFVNYCGNFPMQTYEEACQKVPCLRKCCKYGESMDKNRYRCVPDPNSTFNPSTDADLSNYSIVIRFPLCTRVFKVEENITIDRYGSLILKDKISYFSDFCVDTFLDNEYREESALACLTETSLWLEVRPYLLPTCNVISFIFLMITIVTHLSVPRTLENGGLHQFCLLIAFSIAYITRSLVYVFLIRITYDVCVNLAIVIQFGSLATFFWLNVMCFEIWRKIRRLMNYRPCKSYPNKYYMMYGWGLPIFICMITILMQMYAPDDIEVMIKPSIGLSGCWFGDEIAGLTYFESPKAVLFLFDSIFLVFTYINYKTIPQNYTETTNDMIVLGTGVIREQRNILSRQLTDHVHEFNQNVKIFLLLSVWSFINWVTIRYLWHKNPSEQWYLILDTLFSLQGFCLSTILLSNRNKRMHLEEKYPRLFRWIKKSNRLSANIKRWLQNSLNRILSPMSSLTSSIRNQFSNSTETRTLSTLIQPPNPSSSSSEVQNSVSFDNHDEGVIVLSHSSSRNSDSTQGLAEPSLQYSKSSKVTLDSSC